MTNPTSVLDLIALREAELRHEEQQARPSTPTEQDELRGKLIASMQSSKRMADLTTPPVWDEEKAQLVRERMNTQAARQPSPDFGGSNALRDMQAARRRAVAALWMLGSTWNNIAIVLGVKRETATSLGHKELPPRIQPYNSVKLSYSRTEHLWRWYTEHPELHQSSVQDIVLAMLEVPVVD